MILQIPSQSDFMALVRDVAKKMAESAGFDGTEAERLALAVGEAATNVLEHAYGGAGDRAVELRFEDRGPALRIDVVDHGSKADLRSVPRVDPGRGVGERRTGSLGVPLMEKVMDSVTFRRSARRNVCRLVKLKAGPAGR